MTTAECFYTLQIIIFFVFEQTVTVIVNPSFQTLYKTGHVYKILTGMKNKHPLI